jgi:hypothetical protein
MISIDAATVVILLSLLVTCWAYVSLSRYEGSYFNILAPSLCIGVPAYYFLPLLYIRLFGTDATAYAYIYVYAALAVETAVFAYAYRRTRTKTLPLPFTWSYQNFTALSLGCLILGALMYAPILLQFREFLLDPRQIYNLTRSGFGAQFFLSSTLSYLAIILILFTQRSWLTKSSVILSAIGLLLLHGSKGQAVNALLIISLYFVYARGRKVGIKLAFLLGLSFALFLGLMFAASMTLGESTIEVVESLTQYSDYTRNAMLVIDSNVPLQYGRLAIESNTTALLPRALFPTKPRNFGSFFLTDMLFPEWFDSDTSPAFGVGLQYADFGKLAILYIALFAAFKGWLARIFVNRLRLYGHPADFLLIVFLADIALFPLGIGWFLPEVFLVALLLRFCSTLGASKIYADPRKGHRIPIPSTNSLGRQPNPETL